MGDSKIRLGLLSVACAIGTDRGENLRRDGLRAGWTIQEGLLERNEFYRVISLALPCIHDERICLACDFRGNTRSGQGVNRDAVLT